MALHYKKDVLTSREGRVFGTGFLPNPLPKYQEIGRAHV